MYLKKKNRLLQGTFKTDDRLGFFLSPSFKYVLYKTVLFEAFFMLVKGERVVMVYCLEH